MIAHVSNDEREVPRRLNRMDFSFVLQDHNRNHGGITDSTRQAHRPPALGVLTHTVVPSPVVKWILPARIRHEKKDDVIFVREDSIQIKEFVQGRCWLQDVTVKSDFAATILSARLIGVERQAEPIGQLDAADVFTRSESLSLGIETLDLEAPQRIPPQILVMATESYTGRYLLFIFASHGTDDQVRFISHRRALPDYGDHFRRLGMHLAVDPRLVNESWLLWEVLMIYLALGPWLSLAKDGL